MTAEPEEKTRLTPSESDSAAWVQSIVDKDRDNQTAEAKAINEEGLVKKTSRMPWLIGVVIVLIGTTFWDRTLRRDPPRTVSRVEQQTSTVLGFELAQHFVEAYRDSAGHVPHTLQEATSHPLQVNYQRLDPDRYTLQGQAPNQDLVLKSDGARPDLNRFAGQLANGEER